ncbi:protein of unknown function [Trichlorobacter ammonificans]|uniref:Uncharacterized protein n=1 Tax=Trichlorobacter ammonificans TaxID=2916410 RepID=A0ABM9D6B3_9BACT|nr:protein of unknown function [Trichlorobacter ammonificans]
MAERPLPFDNGPEVLRSILETGVFVIKDKRGNTGPLRQNQHKERKKQRHHAGVPSLVCIPRRFHRKNLTQFSPLYK